MASQIKDGYFMDRDGPRRYRVELGSASVHIVEYVNDLGEINDLALSFGMNPETCSVLVESTEQYARRVHSEWDFRDWEGKALRKLGELSKIAALARTAFDRGHTKALDSQLNQLTEELAK